MGNQVKCVLVCSVCLFMVAVFSGCAASGSNEPATLYEPNFPEGIDPTDIAKLANKLKETCTFGGYPRNVVVYDDRFEVILQKGKTLIYLSDLLANKIQITFVKETLPKRSYYRLPFGGYFAYTLNEIKPLADDIINIQNKFNIKRCSSALILFEPVAAQYRALDIKPTISEDQRRLVVQANALTEQKQYDKAAEKYRQMIEFDPTSYPEAYFNLALLAAQEHSPIIAIFRMKQYLLLVPDSQDARSAQDKIYEWELLVNK